VHGVALPEEATAEIDIRQAPAGFLISDYMPGELDPDQCSETVQRIISYYDMKIKLRPLLGCSFLAALFLSGCGKSENTAGPAATPAPAAAASKPATGRAIVITANDTMKFNLTEIRAKAGEALAVTLTNQGTVPKFSMGHNWVLLTEGADLAAFATDAMTAATTEYIPAAYKDHVLASTKLLGPKESDTVLFYAPAKPGHYPFLCAFPGHMQVGMKGELIVE
jgi:azurin